MIRDWFHAKRLRWWEDRLSDLTYRLEVWGSGMRPSEIRREQDKIYKARMMVNRLGSV